MMTRGSQARTDSRIFDSDSGDPRRSRRARQTVNPGRRRYTKIELVDEFGTAIAFDRFDLTYSGVYLHSELVMYPGEEVTLKIDLVGEYLPIVLTGRVVSAETSNVGRGPGMGIIFKDLRRPEKIRLKRFFSRRFLNHV